VKFKDFRVFSRAFLDYYYYYYYYNCLTAPWTLSGTTRVSWYQKGKTRKVNQSD